MQDTEQLYTVTEIAEHTGLNPETIRRWVRAGYVATEPVTTVKFGWLIRKEEILRHIASTGQYIHWRD